MLRRYMNQNHRNIFISLLDIDLSILANFAAFTTMLKTWETYTTNCIATKHASQWYNNIPLRALCVRVFIYLQRVDTATFRVVSDFLVSHENEQ